MNVDQNVHTPVLLQEVLRILNPVDGGIYLDGTFGAGGYSLGILQQSNSKIIAIDRDVTVKSFVEQLQKEYASRLEFYNDRFGNVKNILSDLNIRLDGAVFDLGVSSMQLDNAERGFSFQRNALLDMRMGINQYSAYDVVNKFSKTDLEDILLKYGEEYRFKGIVNNIIEYRKKTPILTTFELADIVFGVYKTRGRIHPATKTFQAIRAFVNQEFVELEIMLTDIGSYLKHGAKLIVVSFHSLEDRIVKNFFRKSVKNGFEILTKKPIIATKEELLINSRARSAKLRALKKSELVF